MGMFNTTGSEEKAERKENTLKKLDRINKALNHEEPDQVPISDFIRNGMSLNMDISVHA